MGVCSHVYHFIDFMHLTGMRTGNDENHWTQNIKSAAICRIYPRKFMVFYRNFWEMTSEMLWIKTAITLATSKSQNPLFILTKQSVEDKEDRVWQSFIIVTA